MKNAWLFRQVTSAFTLTSVARQLDQLAERRNQSRRRPRHFAREALSPVQTLTQTGNFRLQPKQLTFSQLPTRAIVVVEKAIRVRIIGDFEVRAVPMQGVAAVAHTNHPEQHGLRQRTGEVEI